MLELLSLRKGTTLTKEMFLNHLYGGMDEPELKIIDVFICKLRKKLANASEGRNFIETVWAAAMCCASRTRSKSAFPPDQSLQRARQALASRLDPAANGGVLFRESGRVPIKNYLSQKTCPATVEFYHGTVPSNGTAKWYCP